MMLMTVGHFILIGLWGGQGGIRIDFVSCLGSGEIRLYTAVCVCVFGGEGGSVNHSEQFKLLW